MFSEDAAREIYRAYRNIRETYLAIGKCFRKRRYYEKLVQVGQE